MVMILVLPDLHLDHWHAAKCDPFAHHSTEWRESIHHCIVAGDLINDGTRRWPRALEWLSRQLPCAQIAIFPSNHDFYEGRIDREDKLRAAAEQVGATYAQKTVREIGRTRLLCCTLWTDFNLFGAAAKPSAMYDARRLMNDYRSIRVERGNFRRLHPEDTVSIHLDHRAWLERELSRPWAGDTVVVTHHAPHLEATGPHRTELDPA